MCCTLGSCWLSIFIFIEIALNLRSVLVELTSWQYRVFLTMYIKYLSIYLDLYSFLSAEFYCFPYVYLIHSSFPLSMSLFSHTNINVLCFYLQIPNVHCWYIGKQLIFLYSNILLSCCICVIVPGDFLLSILWNFLHRQLYHLWTKTVLLLPSQSIYIFISFSCLIALSRTSNTILSKTGESKHRCLVPELSRKHLISHH